MLIRLNLKQEYHATFLSFITCIMGNAQVRTIIYRSRVLAEYAEAFISSIRQLTSLQRPARLRGEEREDQRDPEVLAAAVVPRGQPRAHRGKPA
jgi:hypothetical protein